MSDQSKTIDHVGINVTIKTTTDQPGDGDSQAETYSMKGVSK
jgi:hypothetical protein